MTRLTRARARALEGLWRVPVGRVAVARTVHPVWRTRTHTASPPCQILLAIKLVKLYVWERPLARQVEEVRGQRASSPACGPRPRLKAPCASQPPM